ncbi:MAG: hypothetical protein NVSMB13_03800 [Mycobacteriales bacterium]
MRSRLVTTVAMAAGLLVGATGCSHSDKASTLPTPAPSSAAPTTPAPTFPATTAGADAFVRSYLETLSAAAATGRTVDLEGMSASECQACQRFVASIKSTYTSGAIRGGAFRPQSVDAPAISGPVAVVEVRYDLDATTVVDGRGNTVRTDPGGKAGLLELVLSRSGGTWKVTQFTETAKPT